MRSIFDVYWTLGVAAVGLGFMAFVAWRLIRGMALFRWMEK